MKIFGCLILFFLQHSPTLAETPLIFENVPEATKREVFEKFPGIGSEKISQTTIDQVLRLIAKNQELENVQAERGKSGAITFKVILKKVFGDLRFEGNSSVSQEELKKGLKMEPKQKFNRRLAIESGENIKQIYGEKGYFGAIVEMTLNSRPTGEVDVLYEIKEETPCRVQSIDISSSNKELDLRLKMVTRPFRKKNLTQDLLNKMTAEIRDFLKKNNYLTAAIKDPKITYTKDKLGATISLEIRDPFLWQFNIQGNNSRTLSEVYQVLDLNNTERKNLDPVSESIDRLRRYYLSEGFSHISISHRVSRFENKFINRVYLNINEGPRVSIEKYRIEGRVSRPKSYYVEFIESHSSEVLDRGYFNREALDKGLDNLIIHLKNQGFLRAKIQSLRVEFSEDKSKATVIVNMDEGSLTQVRSITFDGNGFFSSR
ncbi:hypothetical protein GW916_00080, partial [bacterium]|nr:hypothetical protein [bacterium]